MPLIWQKLAERAVTSPSVSIIIPTLNEANFVGGAIGSCLREQADEVIVADGGSTDPTRAIAKRMSVRFIDVAPSQRARQMNAGAIAATGGILVFLHADTRLEPGSLDSLRAICSDRMIVGGGFRRFYHSRSALLSVSSSIGNARARRLGWFFGDQAIWVRREEFLRLRGFPEVHLFEDLDFTRKLKRLGPTALIEPGVVTSARRFKGGVVPRLANDFIMTVRHVCLDPSP